MKVFVPIICILGFFWAQGQDSVQILGFEDYLYIVNRNHPVLRQAALQPLFAKAELRLAKGAFDPVLSGSLDEKNFKEKQYYSLLEGTLKIPTWLPLDPKLSIDRNTGEFLNPEHGIPDGNWQVNTGVSLPIGRGLFIDERRAMVQQAKVFADIAAAEQIKIANKILLTSVKDYFEWTVKYRELLLLESSLLLAEEIYRRVVLDFGYGEASVMDTLQASITYQTRQADLLKARYDWQSAGYSLARHLWTDDGLPLELKESTLPDTTATLGEIPDENAFSALLLWAQSNHPELLKIQGKTEQLEIERKLAREFLKPQVDLSYSSIDAPITPDGGWAAPAWNDNYKLGVDVYLPILLRKERGKLLKTELKIKENEQGFQFQNQSIRNDLLDTRAELLTAEALTLQYNIMADTYYRLLQAEQLNLEVGESDLFKLNIQQDKYIDSQLKFLENFYKLEKLKIELRYDAGLPFLQLRDVEN